ncbi:MAG: transposase, partial [Thermoproteota archaeon]
NRRVPRYLKTYFIHVPRDLYPKCEKLSRIAGRIYSKTVSFVRKMHRRKGFWPSEGTTQKYILRWAGGIGIHTHSKQALVQEYFEALRSYFENRKQNTNAKPPFRTRKYKTFVWKNTAVKLLENGTLKLSLGRNSEPLLIPTKLPNGTEIRTVRLVYDGTYKLHVTVAFEFEKPHVGEKTCGVDLGIKRLITAFDDQNVISYHGGTLSAKLRYRNKELAKLQSKQSKCQRGSKRWRRLQRAKRSMLKRINNQVRDILHKVTSYFVGWCLSNRIGTIVVGDIRKIRERVDYNDTANQKIHQWMYGKLLKMLEEKAKIVGIKLVYVNEAYTSKTCPVCRKQNIVKDRRYKCECGFEYHRDGVGAINIFKRYRGKSHVVGVLASPVGLRSHGVSISPWKPAVSR